METLENARARLIPLDAKNQHLLQEVAREPGLIRYSPGILHTPEGFSTYMGKAMAEAAQGQSIPFLIWDKKTDTPAGSTRFMRIDRVNKVVEIGSTWIGKAYWGTGLNTAVKQLMLAQAFGPLGFEKVTFRIDSRNLRSRGAVEKLGAILEGTLREDVYLADGFKRDTCVYGLLRREWPGLPNA
ncbi:GNAT family protein [Robiginitalea sp. M366]|uniref:GNAT family N-acetyltransferase n=1 Tax=Robiginitalea aestuariiviva TaxID=3036903 RepID=UPI00240D011D|nr:GNAT family protein [Robiginitalea aestuariiviva]MDG1573083.1 GNAT family protein [Robiginitalea aestuariiviva]